MGRDCRLEQRHGLVDGPLLDEGGPELGDERGVHLGQPGAHRLGPPGVAVLEERLAGPAGQGGSERRDLPGGPRMGSGLLELVDVDADVSSELDDVPAEDQPVGPDDPAGRVHRLVQIVRGERAVMVGIQSSDEGLPVQPVTRRDREQLHQRPRLAQPPSLVDG